MEIKIRYKGTDFRTNNDLTCWRAPRPELRGFDDSARLDTRRADQHLLNPTVLQGAHPLEIRVETALCHIVGMADVVARHRFFSTDIAHF